MTTIVPQGKTPAQIIGIMDMLDLKGFNYILEDTGQIVITHHCTDLDEILNVVRFAEIDEEDYI